jgi:flagellar hook protein FlgE
VTGQSSPGNIKIDLGTLPAEPTGWNTGMKMALNLNASSPAISGAFSATDPTTYNYSTTATVYDSQGATHTLSLYFAKDATAVNTWNVYSTMDGGSTTMSLSGSQLQFDASGQLVSPTSAAPITFSTTSINSTTGANDFTNVPLDFTGTTQVAASSGVNSIAQDGYPPGQIVGVSIDTNGVIFARYSNNQNKPLQQLQLATFQNPNGLIPLGDNQWAASQMAGSPSTNPPGQGTSGGVQSGATEDSNVDLTNELVSMIVAQRNYQANAQTIKTQDQVLNTLVNLR